MRARVDTLQRVLAHAKRDPDMPFDEHSAVKWKETHGGVQPEDRELKEEKKVNLF